MTNAADDQLRDDTGAVGNTGASVAIPAQFDGKLLLVDDGAAATSVLSGNLTRLDQGSF